MGLIREILLLVENDAEDLAIEGRSQEEIFYHCQLMVEAGLIHAYLGTDGNGKVDGVQIHRLTNAGHDFLDAARSDSIWAKFKGKVGEIGGSVSIEMAKELLHRIARDQLGF